MQRSRLKETLYKIIFEADTPSGKLFDVGLIISIKLSVVAVMLDSIGSIQESYGHFLNTIEWFFTFLFTAEYVLRLFCAKHPIKYAYSFFGIVDLMAILPSYFSLFFPGSQYLLVIRLLRVLRVFRVLKLAHYIKETTLLLVALKASRRKIIVFFYAVICLVVVFGSIMYIIEPDSSGFTSIPRSIYWAIVTLTTVGYGDISPVTELGQTLAALVMILGYSIIAVPTGIVTVEISRAVVQEEQKTTCPDCGAGNHDRDALFCKYCGAEIS